MRSFSVGAGSDGKVDVWIGHFLTRRTVADDEECRISIGEVRPWLRHFVAGHLILATKSGNVSAGAVLRTARGISPAEVDGRARSFSAPGVVPLLGMDR